MVDQGKRFDGGWYEPDEILDIYVDGDQVLGLSGLLRLSSRLTYPGGLPGPHYLKWINRQAVELWEAVALSLDAEPGDMLDVFGMDAFDMLTTRTPEDRAVQCFLG